MKKAERDRTKPTGSPQPCQAGLQQEAVQHETFDHIHDFRKEGRPVVEENVNDLTILLVDDDVAVNRALQAHFRKNGYTVLDAQSGEEALRIEEDHEGPIHVLVTDVMMPEMDGLELAERLLPLRPEMSVLYMSGYPQEICTNFGMSGPRSTFLKKPIRASDMNRMISRLLDGRAGNQPMRKDAGKTGN